MDKYYRDIEKHIKKESQKEIDDIYEMDMKQFRKEIRIMKMRKDD